MNHPREIAAPALLLEKIGDLLLKRYQVDLHRPEDLRRLAQDILRMSTFYAEHPEDETPWNQEWCQRAQLAYYLPLNVIRLRKVFREGIRIGYFASVIKDVKENIDVGSGLGAIHWAAAAELEDAEWLRPLECEISGPARNLRQSLDATTTHCDSSVLNQFVDATMLTASYSLTEFSDAAALELLGRVSHCVIIEPSTREDARRLSRWREALIEKGLFAWAPCTHQMTCPLLHQSETDWCHDRVIVNPPFYFDELEKHLPIRNRTLTFSYLLMSRIAPPDRTGWARLTGDYLKEKGKSRQLLCRGRDREFFAWLDRHGDFPANPRGELVQVPAAFEAKSNELRLREGLTFFHRPPPKTSP